MSGGIVTTACFVCPMLLLYAQLCIRPQLVLADVADRAHRRFRERAAAHHAPGLPQRALGENGHALTIAVHALMRTGP